MILKNLNRLPLLSALCLLLSALPLNAAPAKKKKPSLLQSLSKTLNTSSSGKPTTVTGVRGLDEPGGPVNTDVRDFAAIDRMEKIEITPEELETFMKEGGLK